MGFWGALFGSRKLIEGGAKLITEDAPAALDKMFFTEEEQADFRKENAANFLEMTKVFMAENTSFAIARRILAVMAYGYYFPMLVCCAAMFIGSVFVEPTTNEMSALDLHWRLIGAAGYLKQMAVDQLPIIITITMFYFGPGVLDKFGGKKQ